MYGKKNIYVAYIRTHKKTYNILNVLRICWRSIISWKMFFILQWKFCICILYGPHFVTVYDKVILYEAYIHTSLTQVYIMYDTYIHVCIVLKLKCTCDNGTCFCFPFVNTCWIWGCDIILLFIVAWWNDLHNIVGYQVKIGPLKIIVLGNILSLRKRGNKTCSEV